MQPVVRWKNGKLFIDNTPLQEQALQKTYLTKDAAEDDSIIYVKDAAGFDTISADSASYHATLIGDLGQENSEIVLFVPLGVSIIGAGEDSINISDGLDGPGALANDHPVGSPVYLIQFNQIELSAGAELGSAVKLETPLGTVGIITVQADTKVQVYDVSDIDAVNFFARYALNEPVTD